ncbi:MAG: hypothetical protein ABJD11_18930, partial [Gemmatimonadota bacterium]
MTSRREFVERSALSALGLTVPLPALQQLIETPRTSAPAPRGFLDLLRAPDRVLAQTGAGDKVLAHASAERWTADGGVLVTTTVRTGALRVTLTSPSLAVSRLHLRWRGSIGGTPSILGDAWER